MDKLPSGVIRAPCGGPFGQTHGCQPWNMGPSNFLDHLEIEIQNNFYAKSCYKRKLA